MATVDTPMVDSATTNVVLRPIRSPNGRRAPIRPASPGTRSQTSPATREWRRPDRGREKQAVEDQDRCGRVNVEIKELNSRPIRLANSTCRGVLTGVPRLAWVMLIATPNSSSPQAAKDVQVGFPV